MNYLQPQELTPHPSLLLKPRQALQYPSACWMPHHRDSTVSLLYVGMTAWRLYDYSTLSSDGTEGFWLFTKWIGIDTAFLYSMSGLNIPWLQWSSSTFTVLFIGHALVNWMLMFQIPVSISFHENQAFVLILDVDTLVCMGWNTYEGTV